MLDQGGPTGGAMLRHLCPCHLIMLDTLKTQFVMEGTPAEPQKDDPSRFCPVYLIFAASSNTCCTLIYGLTVNKGRFYVYTVWRKGLSPLVLFPLPYPNLSPENTAELRSCCQIRSHNENQGLLFENSKLVSKAKAALGWLLLLLNLF